MNAISRLLYIFDKKQKIKFAALFILLFTGSLLELCGISMIIPVVQAMMWPEDLLENVYVIRIMRFLGLHNLHQLMLFLIGSMMLIYILKNAYLVIMTYIQYQILWHNQLRLETEVMDIYIHMPYSFHKRKNTAELHRTILTDIGNAFSVLENFFLLTADMITFTLIIILLFLTNKTITLMVSVLLGIFLILYFKLFKRRLYQYGKIGQFYGSESVKCINQAFGGIKEIKVTQSEDYFRDDYREKRSKQISMMKRAKFFQSTPRYLLEAICITGVLLPVFLKVMSGADIGDLISQLAVFAVAAFKLLPSINKINAEIAYIINNRASIDLLYNVVKETRENKNQQQRTLASENIVPEEISELTISDLSFRYEDGEEDVLKNVNFSIKHGISIAFVGPSGAGKTTMADLILGLLEPSRGQISYGGVNIKELGGKWLSQIGYIPQNIYLSDDTIRNNIAFGKRNINDKRVWEVLKDAQLEEFVRNQKAGLDMMIGESGVRISGGQRQRIGIARALYSNPHVLVLDEATSALDNETEKAVMESINYLKGKKTLIIIAHRLSTIENCDEVYEVRNGKVIRQR